MKIPVSELIENDLYQFKIKDYTTFLVGRYIVKENNHHDCFVIERGDGTQYFYELYQVEWYRQLSFIKTTVYPNK